MELSNLSLSTPPTLLSVDVDSSSPQVRVRLAGELALDTAEDFSGAVTKLAHQGYGDVLVDLRSLTFCDAKGLRALLQAHLDLQESGRHIAYTNASPQLRRLLSISQIDESIDLVRQPEDTRP